MNLLKPEFEHKDKRRTLTQILTAPINQINVYEAVYGSELGNHFHKKTLEYFYILSGAVKYNQTIILKKGDIFYPELEESHTLQVISDKAKFMTFLTIPYNKENPDIYV